MADEIDRKIMPDFLQDTFAISLGVCFKSLEMMKHPQDSLEKMLSEAKTLFSIPSDAGEGLQKKAEAVAAVWMEKGASLMEACKETGHRFTDEKS